MYRKSYLSEKILGTDWTELQISIFRVPTLDMSKRQSGRLFYLGNGQLKKSVTTKFIDENVVNTQTVKGAKEADAIFALSEFFNWYNLHK